MVFAENSAVSPGNGTGFAVETGPVARLVIDREAKRNALTRAMWEALPGLLSALAADPEVKVLLVSGTGESFSAGADIGELISGADPADPMAEIRAANLRAQEALRDFPKPTIAVVRGHCIGGGLEIAVNCDFRFAAAGSTFGVTPARIGVVYPPAAIKVLLDLVGPATTKYLLFSGDLLTAEDALTQGPGRPRLPRRHPRVRDQRLRRHPHFPLATHHPLGQGNRHRPPRKPGRRPHGVPALPRDHQHWRTNRGCHRVHPEAPTGFSLERLIDSGD